MVRSELVDPDGRYCIANVEHELAGDLENSLTLVNVYAPNNHKESLQFFTNLFGQIEQFNNSLGEQPEMVIAGDFNFIFDETIDCQNRKVSRDEKKLADYVSSKLYEFNLWDLVQASCELTNFTWRREHIRSRIDYMFATSQIAGKVGTFINKWQLLKTDHAALIVVLMDTADVTTGRSYQKLTYNDIKDKEDKEYVRNVILNAKREFIADWSPHNRLEYVKLMIRSSILSIRARRNREISELEKLKIELNYMENSPVLSNEMINEIEIIRTKIDRVEEYTEEQLRIKSGVKWREEGERSTKFFLNLINSKLKGCQAHKGFFDSNGKLLNSNDEITGHAMEFYSKLYSEQPASVSDNFFKHCTNLDQTNYDYIGTKISIQELRNTLKSCKDSTPGLDGIPYSYYKVFGDLLLPLVLDSWEYGISVGYLAPSHRQSCITIIPKAGKDTRFVRNWRPITMASCDLKIITKSLSLRMAKVLPSIIFESQMAYVPGRDISFNNRILSYIIENVENNDNEMIISFDAEKAFDSVSHAYLKEILLRYNFPKNFIDFFSLLYNSNSAVVQVNGHLSKPFEIRRGVKQGDALSCSLFILAMDPLLRNIEGNSNITPITITKLNKHIKLKTFAYADDIAVMTTNDNSITEIFVEYEKLYHCSGLRLNADKTEILSLSRHLNDHVNLSVSYLNENIYLTSTEKIKICGNYLLLNPYERYKTLQIGLILLKKCSETGLVEI